MAETENTNQLGQRLYRSFEPAALRFKIIAQMLIGLAVFIAIILKVIFFVFEAEPTSWQVFAQIHALNPLEIASYGLGLSAALEFGYLLFTPSIGVAFRPLVLGIASVLLLIFSSLGAQPYQGGTAATWGLALIIAALIIAMAALLWMRSYFFSNAAQAQTENQSEAQLPSTPSMVQPTQTSSSSSSDPQTSIPSINRWGS